MERAVVRIRDAAGVTVGSGFLIGADVVCTCAHVVARAAGSDPRSELPPDGPLTLEFPLLGAAKAAATVIRWKPVQEDETGDVAVLRLNSPPPPGTRPAHLAADGGGWDERIRVLGFPEGGDLGVWVAGRLRGRQAAGWVQIEASEGPRIAAGFSGGPVWSAEAGGVVGMVVAAVRGATTAYMVPLRSLLDHELIEAALPESPYRGLDSFREQDAGVFYGRAREAERLAEYVEHRPLVMVSGGSGCGKSSLVRAALWPRLRASGCTLVDVTALPIDPRELLRNALLPVLGPEWTERLAHDPPAALGQALAEKYERLVLFVDQFEEVAAVAPATATALFELVAELVRGVPVRPGRPPRLQAVLTLRSAMIDEVFTADHAEVLADSSVHVLPMGRDDLRAAVVEPVRAASLVTFEPGLAERIVADALDAPGQLPLVQFALTRLWESQRDGMLTHQAYDGIGQVAGALAGYAESVYAHRLPTAAERETAKRLLTRLARPTDDGSFALAPAPVDELGPELRDMARRLSALRLVVIREDRGQSPVVALAHEALIREWSTLREWLVADRDFLAWHSQLRTSLTSWKAGQEDAGGLLRGAPLAEAEARLAERSGALTEEERRFVVTSRAAARRGVRRWRIATAVIAVLALVGAGLAGVAFTRNRQLADELRRQAAVALAGESTRRIDTDPGMSLQLAQAAWQHDRGNPDAFAALLLQHARYAGQKSLRTGLWSPELATAATNGDGSVIAVAESDGAVSVWTGLLADAPTSWRVTSSPRLRGLVLSDDGSRLAVFDERSGIEVWNVAERTGPRRLREPAPTSDPTPTASITAEFSPDGRTLVATFEPNHGVLTNAEIDFVEVYDTVTGRRVPSRIAPQGAVDIWVGRVEPDGGAVWLSEFDGPGNQRNVVRDVASGAVVRKLPDGAVSRTGAIADCDILGKQLTVFDGESSAQRFRMQVPACPQDLQNPFDSTGRYELMTNGLAKDAFQLATMVDLRTGEAFQLQMTHVADLDQVANGLAIVTPSEAGPELVLVGGGGVLRSKPATPRDDLNPFEKLYSKTHTAISEDGARVARLFSPPSKQHAGLEIFELPSQRRLAGGPGTALASLDLANPPEITFTDDGRYLLARNRNGELIVLSAPDFSVRRRIPLPLPAGLDARSANQGWNTSIIPVAGDEVTVLHAGTLTRWNVESGNRIGGVLPLRDDPTRLQQDAQQAQAMGRPGHPGQILVSMRDGVELWDVVAGRAVRSFRPEPDVHIADVATGVHSPTTAVHTTSARMHLWNPDRDGPAGRVAPMPATSSLVGFAPGGLLVVEPVRGSGSLEFWDIQLSRIVGTLDTPGETSKWQIVGSRLLGLSDDGLLTIELDRQRWLADLCGVNDRPYTETEINLLPPGVDRNTAPCHIEDP